MLRITCQVRRSTLLELSDLFNDIWLAIHTQVPWIFLSVLLGPVLSKGIFFVYNIQIIHFYVNFAQIFVAIICPERVLIFWILCDKSFDTCYIMVAFWSISNSWACMNRAWSDIMLQLLKLFPFIITFSQTFIFVLHLFRVYRIIELKLI